MKLFTSTLTLAAAALCFLPLAVEGRFENACCKDANCGGPCAGTDADNCDEFTSAPEPWKQNRQYWCVNVICCEDEGCGGECVEDFHTSKQCTDGFGRGGLDKYDKICTDEQAAGKKATKCCRPGCRGCYDGEGKPFWFDVADDFCAETFDPPVIIDPIDECVIPQGQADRKLQQDGDTVYCVPCNEPGLVFRRKLQDSNEWCYPDLNPPCVAPEFENNRKLQLGDPVVICEPCPVYVEHRKLQFTDMYGHDWCVPDGPGISRRLQDTSVYTTNCPSVPNCCVDDCNTKCQDHQNTLQQCESDSNSLLICETSTSGGDPHLQLWNQTFYDFHAACDLVYLEQPAFENGLGLSIHIRTTARYIYSFISSAAIKIGDDILEISSFGDYALNQISQATLPATVGGYTVTHDFVSDKEHVFTIELLKGEAIIVRTFKDLVNIKVKNGYNMVGSTGLLGKYGSGDMVGRDGKTIISDPKAFGQEWQVRDDEPMLFQTAREPQYPATCVFHEEEGAESRRRLGEQMPRSAAEKACADVKDEDLFNNCVFDVMALNDVEMASAGAF